MIKLKVDVAGAIRSLRNYERRVKAAFNAVVANYVYDYVYTLSNATPVGNVEEYFRYYVWRNKQYGYDLKEGLARGNWRVVFSKNAGSVVSRYETESSNVAATASERVENSYKENSQFYIINNVPYINKLNSGYSSQASAGYVDNIISNYSNLSRYKRKFKQYMGA